MLQVEELQPGGYDLCGYLPEFFSLHDSRPAAEQLNTSYAHGGGWHPMKGWEFDPKTLKIRYPGDPAFGPVAKMELREEIILIYPHAWVLILQPSGEWEIARCD